MPSLEKLDSANHINSKKLSSDDSCFLIPLHLIDVPTDLPRKDLDEASLEELKNDIKKNGVLEPILVQKLPGFSIENSRFMLQSGLRRFIAANQEKLGRIPARVLSFNNDEEKLSIQLSENLQRKDLHPIEVATCIRKFLDLGYKEKDLAEKVSKSPAWVTKHKKISKMPLDILNDPFALKVSLSELLSLEASFPIHSELMDAWQVFKTQGLKTALKLNQMPTEIISDPIPNIPKEIKKELFSNVTREILIVTKHQHVYNCKMHINDNEDKECKIYIPKGVPLEELKDIFEKIIQSMDPS